MGQEVGIDEDAVGRNEGLVVLEEELGGQLGHLAAHDLVRGGLGLRFGSLLGVLLFVLLQPCIAPRYYAFNLVVDGLVDDDLKSRLYAYR